MEFQFSRSRIMNVGTADKDLKATQEIRQLNLLSLIMISLSLLFTFFYVIFLSSFFLALNMLLFIALYGFTFYFSSRGIYQTGAKWIICIYILNITIFTVFYLPAATGMHYYLLIIPPILIILLRDQKTAVKGIFNLVTIVAFFSVELLPDYHLVNPGQDISRFMHLSTLFISLNVSFSLVLIIEKERSGVEFQMAEYALYDPLTNTLNRRQITLLLEREYKRCMRENKPISFIMIDLDNFKMVNDTYGHEAGDKALIHVTQRMSLLLRETDILGRYGGEEFLIVLPSADINEAYDAAERIRTDLECHPLVTDEKVRMLLTVSCGISESSESDFRYGDILKRADKALYLAKDRGRNCSVPIA